MAKSRAYDLVVFDWDGTLMDSTANIVNALQYAFTEIGLPIPSREDCAYVIGLSLQDAMKYLAPTMNESDYQEIVLKYREHYFENANQMVLYDGATQLLEKLEASGHFLAVATGKSRLGLNDALKATGLEGVFHTTRCADESFSKPNPAMLFEVMDRVGMTVEQTIMIGDTTHDLQMAKSAGTHAIGLTHGAHAKEALSKLPNRAILNNLHELLEWFEA
ncbi:HAD-IIIA family hydrolase [Leeia sp. TBRC 13508]|uniref:HAD-IIIA family hydrolase n=1 Tax=Leeia speluncae TaxID=2884804 RepID=A0ABS8D1Q4_9NEIS|nr:HAD-IIIA family hydrolase [Leeia speluncae]MCB6182112.1 HAD-IIIA family hydrolase [Leeia speluncae]